MDKRKVASLQIYNDEKYILPVLSFIDVLTAKHTKMDISRYNQFRFITGELLKKRIENSYPGSKGEIIVDLFINDKFFEVSFRDKGVPGWSDFTVDKTATVDSGGKFRNVIIDMYVDEIGIEQLGSDGQRIFIRKNIINKIQFEEPKPYEETVALDNNITIRPVVTEEDVVEAIRCIYSEYGYSYSYERLYYVDSFMNMLRNKELLSFLAVNDHGQTAGHFALAFSDMYESMPEISTVVIRKEFRGLGLFSMFMDYCEKTGKENGFRALMGQPVAFHPMSQKAFLRADYTATSLLMSYIAGDIESEYNKNGERLSLCASVKMLDKNAFSRIYPPKDVKVFAKKMYERLGLKYELGEDYRIGSGTKIRIDINKSLNMTRILLNEAGKDFDYALKDAINDSIAQKCEMIELVILLGSPSCEFAYNVAKESGFNLSGIIPGAKNGDYLIMQMLLGDTLNYDNLVLVGEFEELKNDILDITKGKEG